MTRVSDVRDEAAHRGFETLYDPLEGCLHEGSLQEHVDDFVRKTVNFVRARHS